MIFVGFESRFTVAVSRVMVRDRPREAKRDEASFLGCDGPDDG